MIKPLNEYVLLKKEKTNQETKVGGIILPNNKKDNGNVANIVALGDKVENKALEVNKKVIYKEYSTTSYKENDEEYLLIKEEDILAVID